MQISQQKRKSNRSIIVIAIIVAIALLAGAASLAYTQKWWPFNGSESFIIDGINYGPPTKEELENSQNAKKKILEEESNTNNGSQGLKKVSVGVSHSEVVGKNVEIRAFINGIVEGTGTCTATLTKLGAQAVVKSSSAFIDASTSQCEPILIPVSEFSQSGDWVLIVSYKSPTSSGESEKITITI